MARLLQLAYVSRATAEMDEHALLDLLRTARRANAAAAVTGLLLFRDGAFVQAIEGAEEDVRTVFARIEADPRHHRIRVLYERPATERDFASWAMGYAAPSTARRATMPPPSLDVPALRDLLRPDAHDEEVIASVARQVLLDARATAA